MGRWNRIEFNEVLCEMLRKYQIETSGRITFDPIKRVFFQPPEGFKLSYPCIVYELSRIDANHASNRVHNYTIGYTVTAIDKDPDSIIPDLILNNIPCCSFDRHFVSDNLHHTVFTIYY